MQNGGGVNFGELVTSEFGGQNFGELSETSFSTQCTICKTTIIYFIVTCSTKMVHALQCVEGLSQICDMLPMTEQKFLWKGNICSPRDALAIAVIKLSPLTTAFIYDG